jgi:hypothetical protein
MSSLGEGHGGGPAGEGMRGGGSAERGGWWVGGRRERGSIYYRLAISLYGEVRTHIDWSKGW